MSLHDRIMSCLECPPVASYDKEGYRLGIIDAAKAAKEADARIAELEQCLREARESMADWALYVPEYFTEKHGLKDDLSAIDRVLGGGDAKA